MPLLEQRVDRLEQAHVELSEALAGYSRRVAEDFARTHTQIRELKEDSLAFRQEMRKLKDDSLAFKQEMREFKNEMLEFKNEMREFKNEMREFKNEMQAEMRDFQQEHENYWKRREIERRQDKREWNQKWGELAHKMGTMTEDLVHPSIPRIVREEFSEELDYFGINIQKKHPQRKDTREFDAIGITKKRIYLTSTKSTVRKKYIDEFIKEIQEFRDYFPEYKKRKIIGFIASLSISPALLKYAQKYGLMVLAIGEELMEVQNSKGFVPKEW